jgi:signal transduction histidine kinase/CheY-like chemotaxis protein/ligand-binding sensor domain-containing protein
MRATSWPWPPLLRQMTMTARAGFAPITWRLVLGLSAGLLLASRPASAQSELDLSHWRFYASIDGLRESWVEDITAGRDGRHWITHGSVDAMTLFDGYTFRQLPTPGPNLTVREGPDGQVWALHRATETLLDGVQIFEQEKWTQVPVNGIDGLGLQRHRFVPWARDRVLLIALDRLAEFDRSAASLRLLMFASETPLTEFRALAPRLDGSVWVGGTGGIALVTPGPPRGDFGWRDRPLPPAFRRHSVRAIVEAGASGVFVTVRGPDDRVAILRLRDGAWSVVVEPEHAPIAPLAWEAAGETWVSRISGRTFVIERLAESGRAPTPVLRSRALSGEFHAVIVDPDGAFWIATSLGLARHSPPVWRPPVGIASFERHISTLIETTSGELFATAEGALLRRREGVWTTIPLPRGAVPTDSSDGVAELADGRLAFNAPIAPAGPLLAFDPKTGQFSAFRHPNGRRLDLLAVTDGGRRLWLLTRAGGRSSLETSDGVRFTERFDAGPVWNAVTPRGLIVASTGDVFVLPDRQGVGWLMPNGAYRTLGRAEGYPGVGPFCGLEIEPGRYWLGDRDALIELRIPRAGAGPGGASGLQWAVVRTRMQTIRSIVRARDGTIWAAAGSGLHAFRNGSWLNMTAAEGMPDGGVYDVLQDTQGVIWAGTTLGLARLYEKTDVDPPVTTLDPRVNPVEAPPRGDVRLMFGGQDRWDHTPRNRLLYSSRVDEGPWSVFRLEPGASLTGLAPGEHRIDVRAMDRNWNIDPTPAVWRLHVLLPWYRETGFILVGAAGALALCAVVALVVSRQRRLERLVAERTAELAESNQQIRRELEDRQRVEEERARLETQLHQAQKLEAIGRLAGGIAHDFNNLLTVIASYGELMRHDLRPGHPFATPVREIVAASDRATALTRQLLAFGRHQVRHPEPLDLNEVVSGLRGMLGRLIGEDIDFEHRPRLDLRRVLADRGQIEQIIVNLAVNARDAMPDGGKLTVETDNVEIDEDFARTHAGVAPGPHVRLTVSDTGVGMDTSTQERIFEPFFTTKGRDKGTGLGLATVYGIVRQAGGHVWVYSEPGRGAAFKIYLPCTDAPVALADKRQSADQPRGTERVLLVEDDAAVRLLTSTVLREQGYEVTEAESAEIAEALLAQDRLGVDLVLSDIVLSGMSGPQLADRLRASRPDLRVLFMSGYADDAVIRHGILETEVAFIQKPFTPDALARKVRETLDA